MGRIITRADIGYTDSTNRLATAQEVLSKNLDCADKDTPNKLTDSILTNISWYASDEGTYDILGSSTYFQNFTLYIESVYEHLENSNPVSPGYQFPVMSSSTVITNAGGHYHVIQTLSQNNDPATPQNPRVEKVNANILASSNSGNYIMRFTAIGRLVGESYNVYSDPAFKTFNHQVDVLEYLNNNLITVRTEKRGNVLYVIVNIPNAD